MLAKLVIIILLWLKWSNKNIEIKNLKINQYNSFIDAKLTKQFINWSTGEDEKECIGDKKSKDNKKDEKDNKEKLKKIALLIEGVVKMCNLLELVWKKLSNFAMFSYILYELYCKLVGDKYYLSIL